MKVLILAAGHGNKLRPLTDEMPKCMIEVNGKSIIDRQLDAIRACGIHDEDITVVCGYCSDILQEKFKDTAIHFIVNEHYDTTNKVYSMMCAKKLLETEQDVIVSYGDIVYEASVFQAIMEAKDEISVLIDDGWLGYWSERFDNPLRDAKTLMLSPDGYLTEIGQKTRELARVQSQYVGLMHFRKQGLKQVLALNAEAERRDRDGQRLWRTTRNYAKMHITDLLQGLIDEGYKIKAVHIRRGWFEIHGYDDLRIAEEKLR